MQGSILDFCPFGYSLQGAQELVVRGVVSCAQYELRLRVEISPRFQSIQQVGWQWNISLFIVLDRPVEVGLASDAQYPSMKVDVAPAQIYKLLITEAGFPEYENQHSVVLALARSQKFLDLFDLIDVWQLLLVLRRT